MALGWPWGGFGWLQVALRGRTSLDRTGLKSRLRQIMYRAHDSVGQVASGRRFWQDGPPFAGQQFEYAFADIGNWKTPGQSGGQECFPNSRLGAIAAYFSVLSNSASFCFHPAAWSGRVVAS